MLFKLFAGYLKATHIPIEVTDGTVLHRWNTFFSKKIKDFKEGTLEKKILKKKEKGKNNFWIKWSLVLCMIKSLTLLLENLYL